MSSTPIGFVEAMGFVDHAASDQVTAIEDAAIQRTTVIGEALATGDTVRLDGLSTTYLNGLDGTVQGFARTRVIVRVTGDALTALKRDTPRVREEAEYYDLRVHRSCAMPPESPDERARDLAATAAAGAAPVTAEDVLAYLSHAPGARTWLIIRACRTRETALRKAAEQVKAASLAEGDRVTIGGMSPKYLNGLSGTLGRISSARRSYAVIHLDAESTARLRAKGRGSYWVEPAASTFALEGIPLVAVTPTAE